jgi:hypothetical protein
MPKKSNSNTNDDDTEEDFDKTIIVSTSSNKLYSSHKKTGIDEDIIALDVKIKIKTS